MKIKSIHLHPFAGIQDKKIEFSDGLNVILGPNEAGKSTVFKAIQHGLLTTTSLPPGQLKNELGDLFPLSGGDVIRVPLEVYKENPNRVFAINKEWKHGNRQGSASFTTPEGNEFTDEDRVQEMIEALLPVKPGTMKEILLSSQSALHTSLMRVKESSQVRQEIGGMLRKSVMEAGGVSVDKFKQDVDGQYQDYFNNWDRDKNYPENDASGNDRGIHNRHKRNVGIVLSAWYNKEDEKDRYQNILQYEDEIDTLNADLEAVHQKLRNKTAKYNELKPKLDQQQERAVLESKEENIQSKLDKVSQIAELWPVYEFQLKEAEPKLKTLDENLEKLNQEQKKASKKSEIATLKRRIEKLEEIDQKIKKAKEDLEDIETVTEEDVEAVRALKNDIGQKETRIEASKLSVKIKALDDTEYAIINSKDESENKRLKKGETSRVTQNGVFTLETSQLQIHVTAGEDDLSSIVSELKQLKVQLEERLSSFNVKDLQELVSLQRLYDAKVNNLRDLKEKKKEALGDDSLEELKVKFNETGDLSNVRDSEVIQGERDEVLSERSSLKVDFEKKKASIQEWQEEYTDKNGLFGKRAELTSTAKKLEEELNKTEQLPEEFNSVKDFKNYVENFSSEIDTLREKKQSLELKAAEKEGKAPDISSEEQKPVMDEAISDFEKIHKKGESLARVKERTESILAELEQQTYTPLSEGLLKWLSIMSGGRFSDIKLDKDGKEVPSVFITGDKKEIPFHLLSHGTKDLTSLAWKLTVSEKFLNEQSSMILLDDPMVDMDPDRKRMASSAMMEFANQQQVILFSCHPEVGEVMKGDLNTIKMKS